MKVIIIQGMSCIGKTSLMRKLATRTQDAVLFSLDIYKEKLWGEFGFKNIQEKERLTEKAKNEMFNDLQHILAEGVFEFVFLDYPFKGSKWNELIELLSKHNVIVKTVLLYTEDFESHKILWSSRDRHKGHGASSYVDGVSSGSKDTYEKDVVFTYPVTDNCLEVLVSFNPYKLNVQLDSILKFLYD